MFFYPKIFFHLVLFINLGVVAAMSPSMAKLNAILISECVESEPWRVSAKQQRAF